MTPTRGFSLIEVTISIFIMGVMILLIQVVTHSGILVRTSKNQGIALVIVQDKIESVRAGGYAAIPSSGPFSNSLLSTLPRAATTSLTVSTYNAKTKQVIAGVTWLDAGASASSTVSIGTLITETGGLP